MIRRIKLRRLEIKLVVLAALTVFQSDGYKAQSDRCPFGFVCDNIESIRNSGCLNRACEYGEENRCQTYSYTCRYYYLPEEYSLYRVMVGECTDLCLPTYEW
jgi:hypothetical protein